MNPIFIIGTERSGTNLLRLILNSHSGIAVPHPPHIMKLFGPLERFYGNLGRDANFKKLINDVCRMVELHPYPWELTLDRERIFLRAKDRNLISVYFETYNQYLEFTGKKRWACKSTFMIDQVADVLKYYPEARFIFMARDGRDVAVSAKKSIFNHYHVYYSAKRWQREQRIGLDWINRLSSEQITLLKYEDLLNAPASVVQNLCGFLDEPFEAGMLEYHRTPEARKSARLSLSWENTSRPVLNANTGMYRSALTDQEVLLFEAIASRELADLGYPLRHSIMDVEALRVGGIGPKLRYWFSDKAMFLKAEAKHLWKDENSRARLKKAAYMRCLACIRKVV